MVRRPRTACAAGLALLLGTVACTPATPPPPATVEIAMCPEPWRLEDCGSREGEGPSCAFVPAAAGNTAGQPRAWVYDAEGTKLTDFALPLVPGAQGESGRVRLALEHAPRPVHRIVVCSVDPRLPVVRERIVPVVQRTASLSNP
ncbi:MAG: hypothetical protein DI563_22185 [Variovorax paradoxus]|uniref:Uncharacterized protein n=1 Tax=Variovorax paradoxus TaxID=34073 RepID=A0A2W5RIX1_VARPD|nr:MAG: hypothetical protein DI563_22185 [Variovorax paradoxus]